MTELGQFIDGIEEGLDDGVEEGLCDREGLDDGVEERLQDDDGCKEIEGIADGFQNKKMLNFRIYAATFNLNSSAEESE